MLFFTYLDLIVPEEVAILLVNFYFKTSNVRLIY